MKNQWTYLPSIRVALSGIRMALWNGQLVLTGGQYADNAENFFLVGFLTVEKI